MIKAVINDINKAQIYINKSIVVDCVQIRGRKFEALVKV